MSRCIYSASSSYRHVGEELLSVGEVDASPTECRNEEVILEALSRGECCEEKHRHHAEHIFKSPKAAKMTRLLQRRFRFNECKHTFLEPFLGALTTIHGQHHTERLCINK